MDLPLKFATRQGSVASIWLLRDHWTFDIEKTVMIDCKGAYYPSEVMLYPEDFDVRYSVSYRDLEATMAERGVSVDYATLN
jgi:putative transposase